MMNKSKNFENPCIYLVVTVYKDLLLPYLSSDIDTRPSIKKELE